MEQLAQMKRRIKSIETIKKVTHAMRLISMSTHTKLQAKRSFLTTYKETFKSLWASISNNLPNNEDTRRHDPHHLIILIGSEKGLVGTFNSNLFKQLERDHHSFKDLYFIAVGKHAIDYLNQKKAITLATYEHLTADHFVKIAQSITDLLIESPVQYPSTTVYSTMAKSFFAQMPSVTKLLPLVEPELSPDTPRTEYSFEQSPEELQNTLKSLLISVTLQEVLYDSILAEQSSRFITMDASTRNAEKLLTSMTLDYNKLRQASITRELTELTATL